MSRTSLLLLTLISSSAAAQPLVLEGEVPAEGDFFLVPFNVPDGISEIEVRHDDLSSANTLDWGLHDPMGFRGWGGGNPEPAIVGVQAASRSYVAGPLPAGTWNVVVGKAQLREEPARYRIEIDLRTTPTLTPQPERTAYAHAPALETGRRWYAGDFHVHSLESGDARPTLDAVATFARSRGLDFVALSEHNTRSHLDFIPEAQARHPSLLLVPSVEFTTYKGHGNAFGATQYVDHRLGFDGATLTSALEAYAAQGALFTINHPTLDNGSGCIGCAWEHPVPRTGIGAIEIGVGGWETTGAIFDEAAIAYWDRLSDEGIHLTAVGGSDDHRAGVNLNQLQSPIGDPTTLVHADELSVPALIQAVREGRTVVKLRGPDDPMIELTSTGRRELDTAVGDRIELTAVITGGAGHQFRWVENGLPLDPIEIDQDPFTVTREVVAPEKGETRWRAEVLVGGRPRTVTSHVWIARTYPPEPGERVLRQRALPQSCSVAGGGLALVALLCVLGSLRSGPARRA